MRNIKLQKVTAAISLALLLVMPLAAAAQFRSPTAAGTDPLPGQSTATEIILRIIQILLAIAGLVAVIFLIIGGFRYITAGGNEETAESAKKTITNAIIGIVIIILAFVIVRVISNALIGGASQV